MIRPPKMIKTPTIQRLSVRDWEAGTATAFDDRRSPIKGLRNTENMILTQDGIPKPRSGLIKYGPQPVGKI